MASISGGPWTHPERTMSRRRRGANRGTARMNLLFRVDGHQVEPRGAERPDGHAAQELVPREAAEVLDARRILREEPELGGRELFRAGLGRRGVDAQLREPDLDLRGIAIRLGLARGDDVRPYQAGLDDENRR